MPRAVAAISSLRGEGAKCAAPRAGSRAALGIKRASIDKALETLVASIDVMLEDGKPQLTDPMFGLWLRTRRLTPAAGKDSS